MLEAIGGFMLVMLIFFVFPIVVMLGLVMAVEHSHHHPRPINGCSQCESSSPI